MVTRERVVVAMSGGVDSSVAAALLVEQGYEVVGIMLRLWSEPGEGALNRCCTLEAVQEAQRVADQLDIPFTALNCQDCFHLQVVEYFIAEYGRGHTPNPCLRCNRHVKFGYLLDMALALDARYLATGHYARVRQVDGGYQLWRGVDRRKDQSYVLYMLGQEQLSHVLWPLGDLTKPEVRALAAQRGLATAERAESQEVCFVRDQDYRRFLREYAPEVVRPGPILDPTGREIGQHDGLAFYTIGQRKGLGIAWTEPLYVLRMDQARNALLVGPASALGQSELIAGEVTFVSGQPPPYPARVTAKIRYTGSEIGATLEAADGERVRVRLDQPLRDITPGQAAVFYQGEVVLGGGIIEQALGGQIPSPDTAPTR